MSPSAVSPETLCSTTLNHNDPKHDPISDDGPAKISAYYSLVFPNITFYLQTLTVTIGRRCIPPVASSADGGDSTMPNYNPVDVDLGPLKSVSRLHAKIEYEEEDERFVLVVIGRNGAWVDGVWSGAGSRVPLGERSQIQIASRTFHFVLPPPPAPEDSPSPSSNSSVPRARSPSVDITSISPPSSLPSHSPPPREAPPRSPPKCFPSPEPQLPNSNAISRSPAKNVATSSTMRPIIAPTSKKRKKLAQSLPKPDVMPPKPPFTYAQLCYRAIKAMGGKATLQDICGWMIENYDWYRYNEGAGWENSVRHNLSSGRAFKKMERSSGEHGKGFFWSVDEQYERTFEEQEAKAQAQSLAQSQAQLQSANQGQTPPLTGGKDGKKKKGVPLEPPLKRSVKNGNGPLPPPLTSSPLPLPSRTATASPLTTFGSVQEWTAIPVKLEPGAPTIGDPVYGESSSAGANSAAAGGSTATPAAASPLAALSASVCLPIIVGTVPSSSSAPSSTEDPPPIVLHNNTLVLSPLIFSSLAPDQLKALEEMGAQRALEILQGHIVRYLKERMGRRKKRKANSEKDAKKGDGKTDGQERTSLFTTVPLPPRGGQTAPQLTPRKLPTSILEPQATPNLSLAIQSDFRSDGNNHSAPDPAEIKESVPVSVDSKPPVPIPIYTTTNSTSMTPSGSGPEGPASPIIIIDDEDEDDGRVTKKRRIDTLTPGQGSSLGNEVAMNADAVQVVQPTDEDIEIDVC
ncbi:hypothetical protein J3A83DRAFT_2039554 [Scleroderma citrinum]